MTAVSVVVPVYSGQDYLDDLVLALAQVRDDWARNHNDVQLAEVLLVNDAAIDASPALLAQLADKYPWVEAITLSRNFGQHPATICGILHSSGDWVVTMDEDLQHRPEHIETMLRRAVTEHADVVYAAPEGAVHGSWHRDLASRLYKRMLAYLARNPAIRNFSSFRLCRGTVARAGASVAGHETYFDVSLTWFTDRFTFETVPMVDDRFQTTGKSGYSIGRLVAHARRLLISSHTRLLRLVAYLGLAAIIVAGFFGVRALWSLVAGTSDVYVRGWPSLFVSTLFFGGLTAFLLVVTLEYLTNVVLHTQGKPTFFVVDRSGDDMVAEGLGARRGDPAPG